MRPLSRVLGSYKLGFLGARLLIALSITACRWSDVLLEVRDDATPHAEGGSSVCSNRTSLDSGAMSVDGLVAFYPCESASGTAEPRLPDAAGHGHDGTLMAAAGAGPGFTFAAGKVGNALDLVLADKGYVQLPEGLLADACEVTIATWVYINSNVNAWTRIWDFGQDTNAYMFLTPITNTDNMARFGISLNGNTHEEIIKAQSEVPTLKWTHVALVLGAAGGTLYFDGEPVGTNPTMTLRPADLGRTPNNYIGRSQFSDDPYLDAAIDEFRIYDRALSQGEIQALVTPP